MTSLVQRASIGLFLLAGAALLPIAAPTPTPTTATAARPSSSPHAALSAAVSKGDADVAMPTNFAEVAGYRPAEVESDGVRMLVKPTGSCSSPFGASAFDFSDACRRHDLGYDVLRYATAIGAPLDGAARRAVDSAFAAAVKRHCVATTEGLRRVGCLGTGALYVAVVRLNSWRQSYGNPGREPAVRKALVGGAAALLVVLLLPWRRRRATVVS
jgi:hypothetical protein